MSTNAKDLRKQLRNIVQEILPTFFANEAGLEIQKKIQRDLNTYNAQRMDQIEAAIKQQLEEISKRQKEVTELLKNKIAELSNKKEE